MSDIDKPLPRTDDPLTAPFWTATREHRLVVQRCADCSYLRWPPAPVCPECGSPSATWTPVSTAGTLWSYAEYHRAFSPAWVGDLPYTVGLIQLEDGPRMYGTMIGEPGSLRIDEETRPVFVDVTPTVTLVHWRMAERNPS
ncbi:Zn-ribbon domain-containing OB-fold protein [Microbacterium rhizomatis]|uniref:DNA-binding protein n=1 Tax=Microbacterium rhizomatis TaxID=1631477 RepID=A0A5J5J3D0_9MICO|nr:OB-fold domain-containing protein [Microbacterium rhizomatis]KAA9107718.1 hypothetical protein F6B43_09730 [Microbacterium rhizomatis]